jgi:putative ABC transport system permease protein
MNWTALARDVGEGSRAQPARIGLAFLSIAIGMTALVTLLALIGGVRQRTQAMIDELGVNVFGIIQAQAAAGQGPARPLTRRQVALLAGNLPGAVVTGLQLHEGATAGLPPGSVLIATDEFFFRVRPWRLTAGRALDREDIGSRLHGAVASAALAQAMHLPVGGQVRLRDIPFRIVGIADVETGALEAGSDQRAVAPGDRLLFVPWTVPAYWIPEGSPPNPALDAIFVRTDTPDRFDETLRRAESLMQQPDYAAGPLSWITPRRLMGRLMQYQRLIMVAGGFIVVLCLVLGGITLTSLLLSSLQTRIPEIGLRRALGASPAEVAMLFTCEALLVTIAASVAGTALAWGLIALLKSWSPLPLVLLPAAMTLPLLSGAGLGLAASYGPARAAARIAPAEALRND